MVAHYRFGQTSAESFSFTLESRITEQPHQGNGLFSPDMARVHVPLERRVLERIVRGLVLAHSVSQERNANILVFGYKEGFNANMCEAIVGMSPDKKLPLEYTVAWSPTLEPSDDVKEVGTIQLDETSYRLLEEAARRLREVEPEQTTIQGRVTDLSVSDNPFDTNAERTVIVKWINKSGRSVNVTVSLDERDYAMALDAHKKWMLVEVSGLIQKKGTAWQLLNPSNFRVIS